MKFLKKPSISSSMNKRTQMYIFENLEWEEKKDIPWKLFQLFNVYRLADIEVFYC